MRTIRSAAAVALVVIAVLGGGLLALATYSAERDLSVGRIELSVQPFHPGALDIYVPLVDWGARFGAVRSRRGVSIDVRTVDREAAQRLAEGQLPDVEAVRDEARDAVASYLRELLLLVFLCGLTRRAVVALAVRGHGAPRLRWLFGTALGTALAGCLALALLLPPRGEIADPEYYANGPDIPVALRAIEQAQGSARAISEELNEQLVGLARLVSESSTAAGPRPPRLRARLRPPQQPARAAGARPRRGLAAALLRRRPHLERLALRVLAGAADRPARAPVRVRLGNHDSDALVRRMALAGGIVLTERGRLRADGTYGPVVVRVRGLRVAGYSDPFERRASEHFRAAASRARRRSSARSSATGCGRCSGAWTW